MSDDQNQNLVGLLSSVLVFGTALIKYLAIKRDKQKKEGEKMENEKLGIKETMEMLEGLNELSLFVIQKSKDGLQAKDGVELVEKLLLDADFKSKLSVAIEGINKVPAEIKDLDLNESFQLGKYEFEKIQEMVKALK